VPVYIATFSYVSDLPGFAVRMAYAAKLHEVGVRLDALLEERKLKPEVAA
jgi:hypothetical protein